MMYDFKNYSSHLSEDASVIAMLFNKYGVFDILPQMNEKYLITLIDRIVFDYRIMDKQGFVTSKWDRKSGFILKSCIILGGALLSNIKGRIIAKSIKYPINKWNSKIVALPFADHVVRFKRLREMISQHIDIYYHPLFHYQGVKKHIQTFNNLGQQISLDVFKVSDIIKTAWLLTHNYRNLSKCSYELDCYFMSNTCKLPGIIIFSFLYSKTFTKFIQNLSNKNEKRIWLFDYDFDYKYAIFNNIIHQIRSADLTIHLQHGSFVGFSDAYCNPSCDISLCCSPRELDVINKYNIHHSMIDYLGAPLQSFIDEYISKSDVQEYDFLILLSSTYIPEILQKQIDFLSKFDFSKYKVLVRYRPASQQDDENLLRNYCLKAVVSRESSLLDDVLKVKAIVSFSMDALYTCLRYNKRVVIIDVNNPQSNFDFSQKTDNIYITDNANIAKEFNWDNFISNCDECDYSNDLFVHYNFGIVNSECLSARINEILNRVCL